MGSSEVSTAGMFVKSPLELKIANAVPVFGARYCSSLAVAASTTIKSARPRRARSSSRSSLVEIEREEPSAPEKLPLALRT
jgi:hypothetical protein